MINQVVEINDYFYYFLENNNAIVVPKRLLSEDQVEELRVIAKDNYKGEVIRLDF